MEGSRQQIGGQLLPVFQAQLLPDLGLVPLDGGHGDAHVGGDLLAGPVPGRQQVVSRVLRKLVCSPWRE